MTLDRPSPRTSRVDLSRNPQVICQCRQRDTVTRTHMSLCIKAGAGLCQQIFPPFILSHLPQFKSMFMLPNASSVFCVLHISLMSVAGRIYFQMHFTSIVACTPVLLAPIHRQWITLLCQLNHFPLTCRPLLAPALAKHCCISRVSRYAVSGVPRPADRIGYWNFAFIKDPTISNYPAFRIVDPGW